MRCPHCGAGSQAESRLAHDDWMHSIRRLCMAGHKFTTLEVHPNMIADHRDLAAAQRAIRNRVQAWERNRSIASDPRNAREVAAAHKITPTRVRQIRAEFPSLRSRPPERKSATAAALFSSSSTQKGSK
jgi:transcriptional regulator NrdR family protein